MIFFESTLENVVAVPLGPSLNLSGLEKAKIRKLSVQLKSTQENNGSQLGEVQFSRGIKASPEKKKQRSGKFFIFLKFIF